MTGQLSGSSIRLGTPRSSDDTSTTTVSFTLAASDSFNRADNTVLGNTDGAGIDGVTGGSGLAWVNQVGTFEVTADVTRATT